jgi:hypothetical protein
MAARRPNAEAVIDGTGRVYLDGTLVGAILPSGFVYETQRTREHLYRKHQSFGLSRAVYNRLLGYGVRMVRIVYEGKTGRAVFMSTLAQWSPLNPSVMFVNEHGFDNQYHLPIRLMRKIEGPPVEV